MNTALLYHKDLATYSFGEGHPFKGDRFEKFFNFFESVFAPFKDRFQILTPLAVADKEIESVHTKDYINAIRLASGGKSLPNISHYVSPDNLNPLTGQVPLRAEEGARIIVGISLLAAGVVAQGKFKKAIGIGGGMHHAKPDYGEGFCFYNDVAICIKSLQKRFKLKKILVIDTDAHAGNGTMEIFYHDPEVLFIDLHQDPLTLYPGTGFITEIGQGRGCGYTVNLPLFPGTGNQSYQYIFQQVVFPLAREFKPEIIIRYGGSDPHYLDSLTNLALSLDGFRMIGQMVNQLARELTQGRSIDLLLSGYNLEILPSAWSAIIAGLMDIDLKFTEKKPPPPPDSRLKETKDMVRKLKTILKKYWRCMG